MKRFLAIIVVVCGVPGFGHAQLTPPVSTQVPAPSDYSAVEYGPHHTVWARVIWEPTPWGAAVPHTHTFVQLATGLNVFRNGVWSAAAETIEPFPGGAVARQGQHQVIFANNLATPGAIDMQSPDAKEFSSHIIGLSYFDTSTGSNVLIAEIKDCQGAISADASNTVIYPDAFTDIKASVRYTYTLAGLEQDIILEEAPPPPEAFSLDPSSTKLQVLTEFINPPAPAVIPATFTADDGTSTPDANLDFGAMKIGHGRVFFLGTSPDAKAVPVIKQWIEIDQRHFLIEEVPFSAVQEQLSTLPPAQGASVEPANNTVLHLVSNKRLLPKRRLANNPKAKMAIASVSPRRPSLTLDYIIVGSSGSNYVFQANATYEITGLVNLLGVTTLEEGAILKYSISSSGRVATTNVLCKTRIYSPVIVTASDDDSYGEVLNGSTGTPTNYYGYIALDFSGAASLPVLSNFHFYYLSNALAGANITLQDGQIIKCRTGFASGSTQPTLYNVLAYQVNTLFANTAAGSLTGANVTAHYCTNFFGYTSGTTLNLTNSLLVCVTNWQCTSINTNFDAVLNSDAGIFQTVGGGGHYLAPDSPYRDSGTTNINSSLLADLRTKTTYPPIVYSNVTISVDTVFVPQAQRDTDTPDLGYQYEPLDYVFGGATANANLIFTAGTVGGWFRLTSGWYHAGHGIHMGDTMTATFNGRAEAPAYWVRCSTAQEGANGLWQGGFGPGGITGWAWPTFSQAPVLNFNFTRFASLGPFDMAWRDDWGYVVVHAANCEFYTPSQGAYVAQLNLTNCFFDRISMWTSWTDSGGASTNCAYYLRNGYLHGGILDLQRTSTNTPGTFVPWLITDTVLEGTSTNGWSDGAGGAASVTTFNYNAFLTGSPRLVPNGANDLVVASFNWQPSWLGNYYLPTNSPLIDAGSVTNAALAGFYHFTTQTNQVKELNTRLDIGYHYVATDANGKPIDTNGDGTPDYLSDSNGNGTVDSGEIGWNVSGDLGLKVLITRPQSGSVIP